MPIVALHHVQLAMPKGQEVIAGQFYIGLLGFIEVPKPAILAHRGGLWMELGSIKLHLGVEDKFSPAKKAHPAFLVENLEEFAAIFTKAGIAQKWDSDLPGFNRFYVDDPFGNRIELLEHI